MGLLATARLLPGCGSDDGGDPPPIPGTSNIANLGPLGDPDENGLRLPPGFSSRVVARSGEPAAGSDYVWHTSPDGGATFLMDDGGWVYVSNSEALLAGDGGVGALRFDVFGELTDSYPILTGTFRNCAGGPTPWGTWLSCEEFAGGRVWQCDPLGAFEAEVFPALGVFAHEAVAVDPDTGILYLTEDEPDGRLYRYVPEAIVDGIPDLNSGELQVAMVSGGGPEGTVTWLPVPDPAAESTPTREQVAGSTAFDGGEGIWYHDRTVYFTSKGDNRVWALGVDADELTLLYDDDLADSPILRNVDNVTVSAAGDVVVAEDGDDMQIVALPPGGELAPLVQVVGHDDSEITGPAFDPYRQRLYFSSQRGASGNEAGVDGVTYEVTGPFFVD